MVFKRFLDKVYGLKTPEETRALYDAWSESYEQEVAEQGYATPGRIANALGTKLPDKSQPILDFGCGTGLSGEALKAQGFSTIDGCDISPEMVEKAREKGVYRNLWVSYADAELPFEAGDYAAIAAIGVISVGAAPASALHRLFKKLGPGGLISFSFNDHTLKDKSYEGAVNELLDTGSARLLVRTYGDHLPGMNMKSMIYVLEKL